MIGDSKTTYLNDLMGIAVRAPKVGDDNSTTGIRRMVDLSSFNVKYGNHIFCDGGHIMIKTFH